MLTLKVKSGLLYACYTKTCRLMQGLNRLKADRMHTLTTTGYVLVSQNFGNINNTSFRDLIVFSVKRPDRRVNILKVEYNIYVQYVK